MHVMSTCYHFIKSQFIHGERFRLDNIRLEKDKNDWQKYCKTHIAISLTKHSFHFTPSSR